MKIHWSIYLVVGLFITAVSAFSDELMIFILAGIAFMAMGIFRWLTREKIGIPASQKENSSKFIKCPYCKAWNYPEVIFCHYCKKRINQ